MTLSTRIVVKDPVPVEPLFRFCQSLLGDPSTQRWKHVPADPDGWPYNPGYWNEGGQGLPAWLILHYGADGPLIVEVDDPDDPDEAEYVQHKSGCIDIDFDTAYGYRGPNGGSCSDLHAWLVLMVAGWLEQRGAKYEWHQEFTGEWFCSSLDVTQLGDPERGRLPHFDGGVS
jgi:hypothetical protein